MLDLQRLWLVRQSADMRAGITTLTLLATVAAGHPPRDGEAFLFTGKNRTRMKLLMWDLRPQPPSGNLPLAPGRGRLLVAHGGTVRLAYRRC